MARVLGYGGIGNTNGARDFSTKTAAVAASAADNLIENSVEFCGHERVGVFGTKTIVRVYNFVKEALFGKRLQPA